MQKRVVATRSINFRMLFLPFLPRHLSLLRLLRLGLRRAEAGGEVSGEGEMGSLMSCISGQAPSASPPPVAKRRSSVRRAAAAAEAPRRWPSTRRRWRRRRRWCWGRGARSAEAGWRRRRVRAVGVGAVRGEAAAAAAGPAAAEELQHAPPLPRRPGAPPAAASRQGIYPLLLSCVPGLALALRARVRRRVEFSAPYSFDFSCSSPNLVVGRTGASRLKSRVFLVALRTPLVADCSSASHLPDSLY